ncbi:MAG TPA: Rieske 2Fe-2S domain-containing protein [Spirochaetales bacterium]|nr:Rieske 2Fe-2S domain-containing protein [Spirochaetales bacterium]HPS15039.1 Rieske 2Fe-2S domain-containing protein [Spirochaetales bacterium]
MKVLIGSEFDIKNHFIDSFSHGPRTYVVYSNRNRIYVFDSKCPHANGDLRAASYDGDFVVCPSHGLRFSLKNGEVDINEIEDDFQKSILAKGVDKMRLKLLQVLIEKGNVYVELE